MKPSLAAAEPPAGAKPTDLDQRIATLEREIARDEESLKGQLSQVPAPGAPEAGSPARPPGKRLKSPSIDGELDDVGRRR